MKYILVFLFVVLGICTVLTFSLLLGYLVLSFIFAGGITVKVATILVRAIIFGMTCLGGSILLNHIITKKYGWEI